MEGIIETIQSVDTLGVGLTGSLVAAAFLNSLYESFATVGEIRV